MNPYVIGVAGGSGTGKSTLVKGLMEKTTAILVQLDDYVRPESEVPKVGQLFNYDSPKAWNLEKMSHDLAALKHGETIKVFAKDHFNQGSYGKPSKGVWQERRPAPLVIAEGFLTLWDPNIRQHLDLKIFLDAPFDVHLERRIHFKFDEYTRKVLQPMHEKYVAPSKVYADEVIDVSEKSQHAVLEEVSRMIERNRTVRRETG